MIHLLTLDPDWLRRKPDGIKRVLFFDGDCAFCNNSVRKFMKFDRFGLFRYAPLQGQTAKKMLPADLREKENLNTLVLAEDFSGEISIKTHSDAILSLLSQLGGLFYLTSIGKIIPKTFRDKVYSLIAKNRHQLVDNSTCELPSEREKSLLLK